MCSGTLLFPFIYSFRATDLEATVQNRKVVKIKSFIFKVCSDTVLVGTTDLPVCEVYKTVFQIK